MEAIFETNLIQRQFEILGVGKEFIMSNWRKGRRSKKSVSFNPNSNYVKSAVDDFLKNGGTIKKIEIDEEAYSEFIKMRDAAADDFLKG